MPDEFDNVGDDLVINEDKLGPRKSTKAQAKDKTEKPVTPPSPESILEELSVVRKNLISLAMTTGNVAISRVSTQVSAAYTAFKNEVHSSTKQA
jgi:hypothetical protein